MRRLECKAALAVDDAGTITGTAWPFGSPDRVGDVIERGAFSTPARLPMLFAHDQTQAIGIWDAIEEADEGLRVKGRLLIDDVQRAREVRALVREGAVTGLSIGFVSRKAAARAGGGRTIAALDLHEISIVPVPSHPDARITSAKAAGAAKQEGSQKAMEDDETATPIEDRVEALETGVGELRASVGAIQESIAGTAKSLTRIETKMNRPGILLPANDVLPIERKAFAGYLRAGRETLDPIEAKALRISDDTSGGYLAPDQFLAEVLKGIVEFSPIRQAARVGNTASGSVILPKRTGKPTAHWVGETEDRTETGSTYGQVEIPIHESACYVDVSLRLLEDSAVNVEAEVASDLAEEFGRLESVAFLNGNGDKKPKGIMVDANVAYTPTGNASTLGTTPADTLIGFLYAMPATYRSRGAWMMNGSTLAAIRKLKDGTTGVYLWQPAYAEGQPETILGRPVIEAPDMPDIGSGTEPIIFGDFGTAYRIYDRVALSLMRDPYTRAANGLVRFHARRRVGGSIVMAEALRKIRCATS